MAPFAIRCRPSNCLLLPWGKITHSITGILHKGGGGGGVTQLRHRPTLYSLTFKPLAVEGISMLKSQGALLPKNTLPLENNIQNSHQTILIGHRIFFHYHIVPIIQLIERRNSVYTLFISEHMHFSFIPQNTH